MTTATLEKPSVVPAASIPSNLTATPSRATATKGKTILVGFDLGTNKSCLLAGPAGTTEIAVSKVVPSVIGYVKDGIVDGIIAGNRSVLFGDDALSNALHVRLVAPLAEGVIADPASARDFMLRVPATSGTCRVAAAWLAGLDDPEAYRLIAEI